LPEATTVKRFTLLTLLLASSSLVAAPAPFQKSQRKAERPAAVQKAAAVVLMGEEVAVAKVVGVWAKLPQRERLRQLQQQPQPAQPPNADPPG
jgi:hypothetical protein